MNRNIDVNARLGRSLRDLLGGKLTRSLIRERDLAEVAAMAHYFILARTARGDYLNPGAKTTYSEPYRARRFRKKGYDNEQVTLSFTGAMLDALQTVVTHERGVPVAKVGYFHARPAGGEGETDPEILDLARYHNVLGAGRNKVVREFIGLTPNEKKQIAAFIKHRLQKHL